LKWPLTEAPLSAGCIKWAGPHDRQSIPAHGSEPVRSRGPRHIDHPDFRAGGRIFAKLGYPDKKWGMVKLTPEQQRFLVPANPQVFVPAPEAWGIQRSTLIKLKAAGIDTVHEAMRAAWLGKTLKRIAERI
jgi:hypothetical protein